MYGNPTSTSRSDERNRDSSFSSSRFSGDRRQSVLSSRRDFQPDRRIPNPNVFSDEYSLEPLDFNSSSQRTSIDSTSTGRVSFVSRRMEKDGHLSCTSPFDDGPESPVEASHERQTISARLPSVNQVPNDSGPISRTSSPAFSIPYSTSSTAHRSLSTTSRFSIPRALSPFTGQSAPSHPYTMYQQGIGVARTSSVSSGSTVRPTERNFVAAAPPQHPYAMYSQNTVPEEAPEEIENTPIPLGLRGSYPMYQAPQVPVPVPDEVGDIVGPDGHTEQLPPYSRYPDGTPQKPVATPSVSVNTTVAVAPSETPVSPNSGVSSRTLLTENAPPENIPPPPPTNPSPPPSDEPSGGLTEKITNKGRRKICCGLPIWMFVLIGVIMLISAIVGGVIGGLLGAHQGEKERNQKPTTTSPLPTVTVTPSATLDATPLSSTPDYVNPLPTGNFSVPARALKTESNNCVVDAEYGSTWKCRQVGSFRFSIETGLNNSKMISFEPPTDNGSFFYGEQWPVIEDTSYPLDLMQDMTEMDRGPAMFFYAPFDKLVIIHEDDFPHPPFLENDLLRRRYSNRLSSRPGDKPWLCWWNHTLLEAFIYVNHPTGSNASLNLNASSPTITPTPSASFSDKPEIPIPTTSDVAGFRNDIPPNFPLVIKLEEQRFADKGVEPYCEQRTVLDNWRLGSLIKQVPIKEVSTTAGSGVLVDDPAPGGGSSSRLSKAFKRDSSPEAECFCQWFYE